MDIIDYIFVLIVVLLGYNAGYRGGKAEKLTLNPIKVFKEEVVKPIKEIREDKKQEKIVKKQEEEFSKLMTALDNINNYKGSNEGQRKVHK